MHLTKTNYLEYTYCRKNLWLKKHKPELFRDAELSDFEKKIIEEGNLADEEARNLFIGGVLVDSHGQDALDDTKQYIEARQSVIFQATFEFEDFFVRSDILVYNKDKNGYELYEVKASTDVKRKEPHHYINDLAFQKSVIESNGLAVVKAGVIHLNNGYSRQGKLDYNELFTIVDLSDEVDEAREKVQGQMSDMKQYLAMPEERSCECLYRGRNAQCTTFKYSNPDIPEYSVHDIARIGGSKKLFYDWIDRGIFTLEEIDNPEVLKGSKKAQYDAYMLDRPVIDPIAIKETLGELTYPLQFFDYEGFVSAIPMFDGFGAYEQIPFQYSLHIVHKDGSVDHKEFLIENPEGDITRALVAQMKKDLDVNGSVIAWYSSYEKQRNSKLAELHPDHADFLQEINENMFDLMTIFSKNYYVDPRFKGSASIKKVLPVLVPELSYKNLNISKGDQASERWEKMINKKTSQKEKAEIKADLLEYCKLDTWAMVEIWRVLKGV